MLSSLFPRQSIYRDLDNHKHVHNDDEHAFDTGNGALFSADDDDTASGGGDRTAMTDGPGSRSAGGKHRQQSSMPDPFESVPKTARVDSALPDEAVESTGSQHSGSEGTDGQQAKQLHPATHAMDPFNADDDPMAAMSLRMAQPFGVTDSQSATSRHRDAPLQHRGEDEEGTPPKSIMFGERRMAAQDQSLASTRQASPSASIYKSHPVITSPDPAPLASSSHILQKSRNVPWWLRENRKRLGEMADAAVGGSIRLDSPLKGSRQASTSQSVYPSSDPRLHQATNSPAAHTLFLPTSHAHEQPGPASSSSLSTFARRLYNIAQSTIIPRGRRREGPIRLQTHLSKREKALWNWVNVDDLDAFLQEVYTFYVRKGIWSIALAGFLDLLTIGFVIGFSIFLLGCVDYSTIRQSHSMSEVVVPRCVSKFHGTTLLLFLSVSFFYAMRIVRFGHVVKRLLAMRDFFTELLEIPESDIQTVPWPVIVEKLSILRAQHPAVAPHEDFTAFDPQEGGDVPIPPSANKPRLDAHDVANRIMRKENYLIALFNKNVLNTAIPIPPALAHSRTVAFLSQKLGLVITVITPVTSSGSGGLLVKGADNASAAALTKVLEWNLSFCLLGFLFGADGQVRRQFVSERHKKDLVHTLQRRLVLMGFLNAIFAPFILLYLLFYSFFRYFEEYHKNPSSLGSRSYTQLARWKFREFNELPHIFQMRLHRSYPLAEAYISQFPNDRLAELARFVAFISGSFASVLVLFSLLDPDAFLHFEVTKDRTVLFYIGIFGSVMAIARGMVPDDHRVVDPEALMKEVIEETHYLPGHWRGKLHSAGVHREFGLLFPLRVVAFLHELLSVLTTPLVLWFTLPRCSGQIIDFFREFTIHVDGLGYVCSFAVFDFAKTGLGDARYGAPVRVLSAATAPAAEEPGEAGTSHRPAEVGDEESHADSQSQSYSHSQGQNRRGQLLIDERLIANQGKLEKSILNFKAANPNWEPQDQSTSLYLSRMTDLASNSIYPSSVRGPDVRSQVGGRDSRLVPSTYATARSMSRSAMRSRSRHHQPQQASPFTSPILEDEGDGPGMLASAGMAAGASAALDDSGRRSHVLPNHHNQHLQHQHGRQQYIGPPRHVVHSTAAWRGGRSSARFTGPIAEEMNVEDHEDDGDPYIIRPDEGRFPAAAHPDQSEPFHDPSSTRRPERTLE